MQRLDFGHQGFVNGQAASGIEQQHIEIMPAGVVERCAGNIHRVLIRGAGEPFGAHLLCDGFELFDGGGAVHVARDGQHFFLALFDQVLGQLARGRGFTRALQTRHENDGRWLRGQIQIADAIAHGGGQLFVDDADQHLPGREAGEHFLPHGFFFDAGDKIAHHGQGNVGLQQRHADFAQHVLHIAFGDTSLAADGFDQTGEFFGKGGSHDVLCERFLKTDRHVKPFRRGIDADRTCRV